MKSVVRTALRPWESRAIHPCAEGMARQVGSMSFSAAQREIACGLVIGADASALC